MVTSKQCWDKWGDPTTREDEGQYMVMWDVPTHLEIGVIPKRIYCNKLMIGPLTQAFTNLISTGYVKELKTWDGCFNIRNKRGLNAAWNVLGGQPTLSAGFVKCFTDAGFDWGGTWTRKDGMHFQLKKIN